MFCIPRRVGVPLCMKRQFTQAIFFNKPAVHVIGSVNIDHLYDCAQLSSEGKCVIADDYDKQIGGKGLNQAYALFQAGIKDVKFHGVIGRDGIWILEELKSFGFPTNEIKIHERLLTGNVTIQLRENYGGDNAVVLYLGANAALSKETYGEMLRDAKPGDLLVVQNEMNDIGALLKEAQVRGMYTIFNPAPIPPKASAGALWKDQFPTNMLVMNKLEALMIYEQVYGEEGNLNNIREFLTKLSEGICVESIIMTMSEKGVAALFMRNDGAEKFVVHPASPCQVVDTTGAGDTFLGFFVAELMKLSSVEDPELRAISIGCAAASITISKKGAFTTIPTISEVLQKLDK